MGSISGGDVMSDSGYVLITPARNEDKYIEKTLRSVISQTILPLRWVIVSDGSTDLTDSIVAGYAEKWGFIELLRVAGDQQRNFGSKGRAFLRGYERLTGLRYEFIGNLDADISFEPDYFEKLLAEFKQDKGLGIGGGFLHEEKNGRFIPRAINVIKSVPNAVQLFRRSCYEQIGGFIPLKYGGEDWYADVMARSFGWRVETFPHIPVCHLKQTYAAEGALKPAIRLGRMDYSFGSHPIFETLKCFSLLCKTKKISCACRLGSFMLSYFRREERPVPESFVRYIREEQLEKIRSVLPRFCR